MDVYKIGVEIALTNSISGALSKISGQLLGIKGNVNEVEKAFSKAGLAALGVGAGMLALSKAMLNNGAELSKQIGQMKLLLNDYKGVARDVSVATRVATSTPGTTIAQNVKGLKEIMPSVATEGEARAMLPRIMPDAIALSHITGMSIDDILQKGMKAEDLVGHNINPKTKEFDADRMQKGFHSLMSMIVAGGGNISMDDALGYAKQMAAMGKINDDAGSFWAQGITPILEMGGYRAGTAGQAIGRQLIAGKMSKSAALNLIKQGVLAEGSVHYTGGGGVTVDDGGWKGEDLLKSGDFNDWFQKVWKPTAEAKNGGKPLSNYDLIKKLSQGMSANTAARLASLFVMSQAQTARDQSMMHTVEGKNLYKDVMASDMGANVSALGTSMSSLLSVLGGGMVPAAIAGLQTLTKAISNFTQLMSQHPDAAKATGWGTLAGGLAATGYGAYKGLSWLSGLFGGGTAAASAASSTGAASAAAGGGIGAFFKMLGGPMLGIEGLATLGQTDQARKNDDAARKWVRGLFSSGGNPAITPDYRVPPAAYGQHFGIGTGGPVSFNPQVQATATVNIDGKQVATAIMPMIMKMIGGLIPHPTGAPMASSSNGAPAFDSSHGGF